MENSIAQDVCDIENLITEYCHRLDRGSAGDVVDLFTDEATLVPEFDGEYEVHGRSEIKRFFQHYPDHFRANVRHLQHMTNTSKIQVSGDIASAHSYLLATFVSAETGSGVTVTGTYIDALKKERRQWKFFRRTIQVHFASTHSDTIEQLEPMGFEGESSS